jgi:hypothetical protein
MDFLCTSFQYVQVGFFNNYYYYDINSFLNAFNHKHVSRFELHNGTSNNSKTNYLGLTIHRQCNTLEFGIFRKPTYTDVTIPFSSRHPKEQKYAAIRCFINRLDTYHLNYTARNGELINIPNLLNMSPSAGDR